MDTVLVVCTHNSSRSQMAEGLLRDRYGDRYKVHSAGTNPGGVNPFAVEVLDEIGIDLSDHTSAPRGLRRHALRRRSHRLRRRKGALPLRAGPGRKRARWL